MENSGKIDNKNLDKETIIDNLKRGNSKDIIYPAINPFDENGELEDIDFPEGGAYPFIYSNLSKSEIPDYLRTLRSKSIIEYAENLQKLKNIKINEKNIIHEENINELNNDNKIEEDNQQEDYIWKSRTVTNKNDFFNKNSNHNYNIYNNYNSFNPNSDPSNNIYTSTVKNYRSDPVLFQNKWKEKISTLNKWIKEGKAQKYFDNIKQGISQILIGLDEIEQIILNCIKIGDEDGRVKVSNIKSDMEQTCYRFECLIQGKKVEKFKSAFDGNGKKYYFNKSNLLEENINMNLDVIEQDLKKEKKMKRFGRAIKNSFKKVGRKLGKSKSKSKEKKKNSKELDEI
jgi:hypothetical protein